MLLFPGEEDFGGGLGIIIVSLCWKSDSFAAKSPIVDALIVICFLHLEINLILEARQEDSTSLRVCSEAFNVQVCN